MKNIKKSNRNLSLYFAIMDNCQRSKDELYERFKDDNDLIAEFQEKFYEILSPFVILLICSLIISSFNLLYGYPLLFVSVYFISPLIHKKLTLQSNSKN